MKTLVKSMAVLILILSSVCQSAAPAVAWEFLGECTVTQASTDVEINVSSTKVYKKIELRMKKCAVYIDKITIHYQSGNTQVINKKKSYKANKTTGNIKLNTSSRITKVVIIYNMKNTGSQCRENQAAIEMRGSI